MATSKPGFQKKEGKFYGLTDEAVENVLQNGLLSNAERNSAYHELRTRIARSRRPAPKAEEDAMMDAANTLASVSIVPP
jgi:hypothetical protein